MDAIILAAGVGARLAAAHAGPKVLLDFEGRSLLARHLSILRQLGIRRVTLCVGHRAAEIESAGLAIADKPDIRFVHNEAYREGSMRSLWAARGAMQDAAEVLLMDADVLYPQALLARLVKSAQPNCLLMDTGFEPGEEPVKIRLRGEQIVEFRKQPDPAVAFDREGESVGFFRMGAEAATALCKIADDYVTRGLSKAPHEEALRDLFLANAFAWGVEDIAGIPWLEIDFPRDVVRAREKILPEIGRE